MTSPISPEGTPRRQGAPLSIPTPRPPAQAEGPEGQKGYLSRIAELRLPQVPAIPKRAQPDQSTLAALAAALAPKPAPTVGAAELAAQALQLWDAAGRALHIDAQARTMAAGILHYSRADWQAHAAALIALLDDLADPIPGQTAPETQRAAYIRAQQAAGLAVNHVWNGGPGTAATLKALFPLKRESEQSRAKGLKTLLAETARAVANSDELRWHSTDGDFLRASIEQAWAPLRIHSDAHLAAALAWARSVIASPDASLRDAGPTWLPCVARWLAVSRQDQMARAMARA